MIEFEFLNKDSLLAYIESEEYELAQDLAISKQRAISHIENPRATQDDILLILAKENNELIGYTGILPDLLNSTLRFGWLSCLWVSEKARGKNLGSQLIEQALDKWNNKIISADYVPFTLKLYQKTEKFDSEIYIKSGLRLYILSDLANILPNKHTFFSKIKGLIKGFDFVANLILKPKLSFFPIPKHDFTFEIISDFTSEDIDFIEKSSQKDSRKRNSNELLWIKNFPWILEAKEKSEIDKKYYFSSVSISFKTDLIRIKNKENELDGILMLTERNGHLKIPFLYHKQNMNAIVLFILEYIKKHKIKTISIYNPKLIEAFSKVKSPSLFKKEICRNHLISIELKNEFAIENLHFQDGDGDCAFT